MSAMRTIEDGMEKFFINNREVSSKDYLAALLKMTYQNRKAVATYEMEVDGKMFNVVQF